MWVTGDCEMYVRGTSIGLEEYREVETTAVSYCGKSPTLVKLPELVE